MKKFEFMFLLLGAVLFSLTAKSDGLPANPWQNRTSPQIMAEEESQEISVQATALVADIWSNVRDTKEFRQWSLSRQSKQYDDSNQANNEATEEEKNLLFMLENLNRVGYALPSDYKNIIRQIPKTKTTATKQTSQNTDYNQYIRKWRAKYNQTKNNSLNILENSYRRTLATLKRSTGIDINRAINDSMNAFK